jgi:penicillin-binding protein 1A
LARIVIRLARQAIIAGLFLLAALLGSISGVLFAYTGDLPAISALDDYEPSTITRVRGIDGQPVGDFAIQRRVVIGYDDIPKVLREAIIAAEDAGFEKHFGLSASRIAVTALRDLIEFRKAAGASTITQQLARKLFLTDEQTWERKIKEAILAIQIEKRYTKREILTLYCNQMYLYRVYGVEAASRFYFGKSAKQLTLGEAAMIAGIFQTWRNSPYVNMERAKRRRAYVLQQMADEGYITQQQADETKAQPIVLRGEGSQNDSIAPYFLEEVRKSVESRYGTKQLYEGGLTIQTSLDTRLQRAANAAMDAGLRRLDKLHGFRKPERNLVDEQQDPDTYQDARWSRPMATGDIVPAVVTAVERQRIEVRVGERHGEIGSKGFAWTRRVPEQLVRRGDLVELRIELIDDTTVEGSLEQPPLIQGALLAIDNRSGQIRAMYGGFDFDTSKFNRALQAHRQVGSTFKPIVYTAAIDRGYTPSYIIDDVPTEFDMGPDQPPYAPPNYDLKFEGPVTLRRAIEGSRNIPAVKMMQELGPELVISYARRLGIESPIPPYLSVALGAAEATLLEMTRAFSVFPNQGVLMTPYFVLKVQDREGHVLEEHRPDARDAIRADTAYVMTSLLEGVIRRGSGSPAAALGWPLGGKTGTTDDYSDAWFIGFDPDITVGVWVGYDQKRPIGRGQTGTVAALPIWIEFMKAYIGEQSEPPTFAVPGNIEFVTVDRHTGQPVEPGAPDAITETFIAGTQPGFGR